MSVKMPIRRLGRAPGQIAPFPGPLLTRQQLLAGLEAAGALGRPVLHVCRERDVGLFSLIQQVIANIPWALREGRIPVADFRHRTCYWTAHGYRDRDSVWEYYFEPIVAGYPAAAIPDYVSALVEGSFPDQSNLGYFADAHAYVTNHYGDHESLRGTSPRIPYTTGNPSAALRQHTSEIIRAFIRPRQYVERAVGRFYDNHMRGREVIGVHIRGTDAVSARETREYRQGSLDLERFAAAVTQQLNERPRARVLVATDAESSLRYLADALEDRVFFYDAVRHTTGEAAGRGPTGCIMPAYVAADSDTAARNGEDAVVEYLLLTRCSHLVHNGASLATTVLLHNPLMPHTNTHCRG
jgi:hypothetical protein